MAGFFTPTNGGLAQPVNEAFINDPRQKMIEQMMAQSGSGTPQYGGPWAALARSLAGGLAGISENKLQQKYQQRQNDYADTIKNAMIAGTGRPAETQSYGDGTTINWDAQAADPAAMTRQLAANPDTSTLANSLMTKQQELAMEANKPITPFERTQLQAENLYDPNSGKIVPKFDLSRVTGAQVGMPNAFSGQPAATSAPMGTPGSGMGTMGAPGQPAMGTVTPDMLPPPATMASTMGDNPKAQVQAAGKFGENLAGVAAPGAGEDPSANAHALLATVSQAMDDNKVAPGGAIVGPAMQLYGRVTNDAGMDQQTQGSRDAYTNLQSAAKNIAALGAKAAFPSRVTNSDLMVAQQGMAFDEKMSTAEKASRLQRVFDAAKRNADVADMQKGAAMMGQSLGPGDIRAYYLSQGVDPETFKPTKAQPLPPQLKAWMNLSSGAAAPQTGVLMPSPSTSVPSGGRDPSVVQGMGNQPAAPAAPAVKVSSQQEWAQLSKGTPYIAPDGSQRVKQ